MNLWKSKKKEVVVKPLPKLPPATMTFGAGFACKNLHIVMYEMPQKICRTCGEFNRPCVVEMPHTPFNTVCNERGYNDYRYETTYKFNRWLPKTKEKLNENSLNV